MYQKEILTQHRFLAALSHKHPDRYVAMVGWRVLALGKNRREVLKKAERKLKKNEIIGLFYLPGKRRPFYLLKNTRVHTL